jgi:signal transduction histidine kinase
VARVIAVLTVLAAMAAVASLVADPGSPHDAAHVATIPLLLAGLLVPAAVGLFVGVRRPGNRVALILQLGGLAVATVLAASGMANAALDHDPASTFGLWAATVAAPWPVIFLWPLALAFAYPDGELPSPRWRWVARAVFANSALIVVLLIGGNQHEGPHGQVPTPLPVSFSDAFVPLFWICWAGLLASLVAGAVALVARYRAGDSQRRRQVLWLAYGAVLLPLWLGGGSLLGTFIAWSSTVDFGGLMILQVWPAVAVAVAVTRHGLYAIDRLFTRTLVYAALTALLIGTYALVALLAGLVVGGSAFSASLATLAAALLFLPLRDRLQRAVDRRFAKARFDAVRRLRDFLEDVREGRAEPENVGGIVALALEDPRAEIVFRLPATGAYAGADGTPRELPDDGRARSPIGRDLGVLLHAPAPPDLLRGVLQAAAVPVELARLRVELRLQLAEVESSRARIAMAGYEERRRIERDLHDGAQQRLVTLGIVLRRLQRSLPREARLLGPSLDAAVDEVAGAIGDLRALAAGVRPPRLDDGLAAALADLARGSAVPVNVEATPDRAPPEVEAAAYFVACEALTNAVKHASPTHVQVRTARENGVLRMTIADDGVGGATVLRSLRDRVAAQGGTLVVDSPPGAGTRIAVELPCGS